MTKQKLPRTARGLSPQFKKEPRVPAEPDWNQWNPTWRIGRLDVGGPFSWKGVEGDVLDRIWQRLAYLEKMTWNEILIAGKKQNHAVSVGDLSNEAQDRLVEIGADDVDVLVSLRVSGQERIFGIRDRCVLELLWWDPHHRVCPSQKSHT